MYVPLPEAYRSLSRPSSAPDAKAFPLRSFLLDHLRTFWFSMSLRIMQAREFSSLIVVYPFFKVPLLKLFLFAGLHRPAKPLCCLACLSKIHCSVFKVHSLLLMKQISVLNLLNTQIRSIPSALGGPEWARTTDLTIISRTL